MPFVKGHTQFNTGKTRFKKGYIPWNKGKKMTYTHGMLGKKHTVEAREKQSKAKQGIDFSNNLGKYANGGNLGENHPNWKGGNSRGYRTGYHSKEYKEWRKSVFERDDFTCQHCGAAGYITAHHIKSFAHHPKLRFDVDNGITLCEECHMKTDNYKGRNKGGGDTK